MPKTIHRSCSIIACAVALGLISSSSCIDSRPLSYPNSSVGDYAIRVRGGAHSRSESSYRKKRKRRKQKIVTIESDVSDFGNPLIPDLSENENEEKIIMALSHGDEDAPSNIKYIAEDTLRSTGTRKKTKIGKRKRSRDHNNKAINKRRKQSNENIKQPKVPSKDVVKKSKSEDQKKNIESVKQAIIVQEALGDSPKAIASPSSTDRFEAPKLPTNATLLSARQNLTSTVDESLSRLKRMNERKQEIPTKITNDKSPVSYTAGVQKNLFQNNPQTNRQISGAPKSSMVELQRAAAASRRNSHGLNTLSSVNKPTPVQKRTPPTTMSLTTPWARKFILSRPKDALLPIPREFLSDGFNLVQLSTTVEKAVEAMKLRGEGGVGGAPNINSDGSTSGKSLYKAALRLILKEDEGENSNSTLPVTYTPFQIQKAAEVLYTMVHARYVTSPRGLDTIRRMFKRNTDVGIEPIFGRCSRINCNGMPLLPVGISDNYDIGGKGGPCRKAMRYCPSCNETFYMWDSKVDGAAWGTSFAHLFLMAQGSEVFPLVLKSDVVKNMRQPPRKIFGFRIHPAADSSSFRRNIKKA